MNILLRHADQFFLYRILANVVRIGKKLLNMPDPTIVVTRLSDLMHDAKFSPCPERESTFDQLHGSLQSHDRSDEEMEMIRHDHKVMEQKFTLVSVMEENVNKKLPHPVRLEKISFLE